MLSNDACVGRSLLTSEVLKDRVMVIWHMVGCWRTRAGTGIVRTEKREHTTGNVWWSTMCLQSVSGGDRDGVGSVIQNLTKSILLVLFLWVESFEICAPTFFLKCGHPLLMIWCKTQNLTKCHVTKMGPRQKPLCYDQSFCGDCYFHSPPNVCTHNNLTTKYKQLRRSPQKVTGSESTFSPVSVYCLPLYSLLSFLIVSCDGY